MKVKTSQVWIYFILIFGVFFKENSAKWVWNCTEPDYACERTFTIEQTSTLYSSVELCRLVCGSDGIIWPLPYSYSVIDKSLVTVNISTAWFNTKASDEPTYTFLEDLITYFTNTSSYIDFCTKQTYTVQINLEAKSSSLVLNWDTDESYELVTYTDDQTNQVTINITAETVFGVRHGLESLLQLIVPDDLCYVMLKSVQIKDKPFYKHRGLLLDSGRNYLSVDIIKKNIIAMASSKMNVLHWHLSDSQSFPFVSSREPNMSRYGAYSDREVYNPTDVADLIKFAKIRGVRIIPEIDGPAHVGSGWQWSAESGLGNLVVCQNQQPYRSYCIQPPCGQLNPANPWIYEVLRNIYNDITDLWEGIDAFHMGGDEVYIPCWNSSEEILQYIGTKNRSEEVFLNLWAEFQSKATQAFDTAKGNNGTSLIVWTSSLTDPAIIENNLPKDRYVIQTWVPSTNTVPQELIDLGYKIIVSTKDKWYLDHGFWGSTSYYTWRQVYDNQILSGDAVLGGEICMWGELVNDNNVEPRVWPRAAAAAERLWSNPQTSSETADGRFFIHNDRLNKRGIRTSAVIPKFCAQNVNDCAGYLTF